MTKCLDCPAITIRALTGRCRTCAARHRHTLPEYQAIHRAATKRGAANRIANPEELARLRAAMLAIREKAAIPENMAKANASRDKTVMGWCPKEYRAMNERLRRNGHPLAERKAIITQAAEKAERDRRAAMSPFERQLERVRNGAKLTTRVAVPRGGYDYSLTGGSMQSL